MPKKALILTRLRWPKSYHISASAPVSSEISSRSTSFIIQQHPCSLIGQPIGWLDRECFRGESKVANESGCLVVWKRYERIATFQRLMKVNDCFPDPEQKDEPRHRFWSFEYKTATGEQPDTIKTLNRTDSRPSPTLRLFLKPATC